MDFSTAQLLPACELLFGAERVLGTGFLHELHDDLLKQAFRRRAFETHPDRAPSAGLDPMVLTRRFQEVQAAKDLLTAFIADRTARPAWTPPPAPRRPASPPRSKPRAESARNADAPPKEAPRQAPQRPGDTFWRGPLPTRRLPIGEFLFYGGRVSLFTLIAAIHAQRTGRPSFGQLAAKWGYIKPAQMITVAAQKLPGERLGETAVRVGALTAYQRDVLLGFQWGKQRRFGRYFVDAGVLTERDIAEAVRALHLHNFVHSARRAG